MGLFILKIIKNMKLQLIEKISRQAVALVLLAGICLLYNKGIVPVYTIGPVSSSREQSSDSFSGPFPLS